MCTRGPITASITTRRPVTTKPTPSLPGSARSTGSTCTCGADKDTGFLRSVAVLFEEMCESAYTVVIVADVVFLVGRMQAVVRQAEAHQNRGNSQVRGEVAYDR